MDNIRTVIACAEVTPGSEKEFLSQARILVGKTRNVKGIISYNVFQDPFHPTFFIFYQEYMHLTAYWEHSNSNYYKAFLKATQNMLVSKMKIKSV